MRSSIRHALFVAFAVVVSGLASAAPPAAGTDLDPPSSSTITEVLAASTQSASTASASPATMSEYWNGDAEWVYQRRDSWASTGSQGYYEGTSVTVGPDDAWYLFRRHMTDRSVFCTMGIVVQKSTDQGATWSAPQTVVTPAAGTAYSCAATDGSAWYNATTDTWVLLFQCFDGTAWAGCLAQRSGPDPMGAFTAASTNPVVSPGELWNQICDTATDDCTSIPGSPGRVFDEGTFNIFRFDGTYYWVGFHGFDGVNGYRGIAKTADFETWIAGDPAQGTPADAVFDRKDSQSWREAWAGGQSVGGGHGSILEEGGQFYQLVESADISLACTDNQRWDFGLYRSSSLTSTAWSPIPAGNPILYSGRATDEAGGTIAPCNVQYTSLFKDPVTGYIWLAYGRNSHVDQNTDALYWFRLEKTGNLLVNSDFWRSDTVGFQRLGTGTNWAVYRLPGNSYDGTPYLAMNCGGTCGTSNSLLQDVAVSTAGKSAFHASLRSMRESGSGSLTLAVWQLDASGAPLTNDTLAITPGSSWSLSDLDGVLLSSTATLRYEIYLHGDATFRFDELGLTID
ncbi:hypothetical protein ACI3KS_11235 [Microbacterium sp. ZW T5_45]|uniref:hypothetical protein n=1 Tax=Microbacterium sp. ZW T5_45 TaxID=3378080 RepID=UPI0038550221